MGSKRPENGCLCKETNVLSTRCQNMSLQAVRTYRWPCVTLCGPVLCVPWHKHTYYAKNKRCSVDYPCFRGVARPVGRRPYARWWRLIKSASMCFVFRFPKALKDGETRKRASDRHGKHTRFPMSLFFSWNKNSQNRKNIKKQISKLEGWCGRSPARFNFRLFLCFFENYGFGSKWNPARDNIKPRLFA
jgi:hypothetical protein